MAIAFVRTTLILAVFNLAIWCSIAKSPNLMYRQYFCVYSKFSLPYMYVTHVSDLQGSLLSVRATLRK